MTQRIGIETPNGTVYLGEECKVFLDHKDWVYATVTVYDSIRDSFSWGNLEKWYGSQFVLPLPKKKIVPMTAREVDDIINVKRLPWKLVTWDNDFSIGGSVISHNHGVISILGYYEVFDISTLVYESPDGVWTKFEKELTL